MAAPHNKKRYGETWPESKIAAYLLELEYLKQYVTLSGGWAWHFMSPRGHTELKHAHDHKDVDVFVNGPDTWTTLGLLCANDFKKVRTRFDKVKSKNNEEFRRFEKHTQCFGEDVKIVVDMFIRDRVPSVTIDGWRVVEPGYLLTLYSDIHSSNNCFSVLAAKKLLEKKISPIGRQELVEIPK